MATRNFWSMEMAEPPALTSQQWNMTGLLGVLLLVAAILQIIGFSDFANWLNSVGFTAENVWAVGLIVAEVWAALSMFKLRLIPWFRTIGVYLTILVSGFWFIENLRLVSDGRTDLASSGFFGRFLEMSPGWWSVIAVSVVVSWAIYSAGLLEKNLTVVGRRSR